MTIKEICARHYEAHKGDCSGFARAVARDLGVPLAGMANEIADTIAAGQDGWEILPDGSAAAAAASDRLVIGGLRGDQQAHPSAHGHVVVVVPGGLSQGRYPTAWWGSLGGKPDKDKTVNWAWSKDDRDNVVYAAHAISV